MSKIVLVTVGAAAYVLGTKAGRERYQQISDFAQRWWNDPRVQKKTSEATEAVRDKAPAAKKKLVGAAKQSADKAKSHRRDDSSAGASTDGASTDDARTAAAARGTSTSGATSSA